MTQVPVVFDEVAGEPVEQLGMGREAPLTAEVLARGDKAVEEKSLPVAVHGNAGGEGVCLAHGPLGQPEPVVRSAFGQGREEVGDTRRDRFSAGRVKTALKDVALAGSFHLLHHHDLGNLFDEGAALLPEGGEFRVFITISGIDGRKVVREIGDELILSGSEGGYLCWCQGSVVNAKVIDETVFESAVTHPLPDDDSVTTAAGDLAGEFVADDLELDRFAIDVEAHSGGAARAVVGQGDVLPGAREKLLFCPHPDGVAGLVMNESGAEATFVEEQFVAAARGVGPGFGTAEDDGALFAVW